ncbi:macro domain-containing protein [Miniphocaeibacter halophilus]|uniref:Macro domain-containing protein n=1 Tax=Miniphocaeibacter halophilus TaxID=2931922 RepID=A0AC61MR51_9FIRM|nr:macro domain-containing protein [Miniphocaeibacter halophilus]QQK07813.1 macro domain-containing protein [Miniphocaeibacter halophilus]
MDIRFTNDNIFDVNAESIVYFTDNTLIGEKSNELIENAGERILETIQKLNGCPTGEVKIIPGYNLKQNYVFLSVLPEKIENKVEIELFKSLFNKLFILAEEYKISSFAIDVLYMQTIYGDNYIRLLNNIVRSTDMKYNDYTIYMSKEIN